MYLKILFIWALPLELNGYGYDGYSTCTKPYRNAKAKFPDLPCDFNTQSWCMVSGSTYPWHAVRRFVFENHGLMKRMYGEQRHISVLRAAMDGDDVEGGVWNRRREESSLNRYEPPQPSPQVPTSSATTTGRSGSTTTTGRSSSGSTTTTGRSSSGSSSSSSSTTTTGRSSSSSSSSGSSSTTTPIPSAGSTTTNAADFEPPSLNATAVFDAPTTTAGEADEDGTGTGTGSGEDDDDDDDDVTDESPDATTTAEPVASTQRTDQVEQPGFFKESTSTTENPQKSKGVNACPVKEEVVAPFWANNTRGEVLALLNLYPFEQYVHWERCTFENKQMFCRQGCRCEQQYRLHRLLAYDPSNDCRGIFSDWFKFPSCCVCRCYDLPNDLRITSRSPRADGTSSNDLDTWFQNPLNP